MKKLILLGGFLLPAALFADQIALSQFSGLNNNQSSNIIDDNQAQDLLNVDLTPNGKSVKKRPGFGLYKSLGSGQPVRGAYHFYNSGSSDVQLWGSSTSLYGITSDGAPAQIVSSATLNTTWQCADTQGSAYCVDSSRDLLLKTDGAVIQQWITSPLGTMVAVTPDRLVVAGVSGARNSLYFSQSNVFNNFTTGINPTDPFIEPIAAPGASITHIRWGCQKLLWWKNSSFGYMNISDQFNLNVVTVNDTIGTVDNSSAIDPGGTVWFRGQDGHIYSYDCSALRKESIDITPLAQASANRTANSWTQTSQADFQTGISTPTGNVSFTASPGDVTVNSFTANDDTTAEFNSGTLNNVQVASNHVQLAFSSSSPVNGSFEFGNINNWTLSSEGSQSGTLSTIHCTITPRTGSKMLESLVTSLPSASFSIRLQTCAGVNIQGTLVNHIDSSCGWTSNTLSHTNADGQSVRIKIDDNISGATVATSDCFIQNGADITFYTASDRVDAVPNYGTFFDDFTNGRSSITVGSFTSQVFDTGSQYSFVQSSVSWTANSTTPSFVLQKSADGSTGWTDVTTSSGITSPVSNRYIRYISTMTMNPATDVSALSTLNSVYLLGRSSGTFYSAVKNAPNLTAWDTFSANKVDNGGSHLFYIRSSTNSFTTASSTPAWVAQTAGALVSASTGTFFQFADSFTITNSTQTPTLNDFTINWFEGLASDKAYAQYFDNSIWWSIAYGAGQTTNNYIFKMDLINKAWLLYTIGTGGMLQQGNYLYFGSTTTSNTFKYGSGTSDNGTAIQAFWKSKDFGGQDPWLENQYNELDSIYRTNANQSLTVSYALNTSTTTTSYSVNLSSSTQGIIRNKKLLPNGKNGGNINIKFGDTSDSSAWELLGLRFMFTPLPYKPTSP